MQYKSAIASKTEDSQNEANEKLIGSIGLSGRSADLAQTTRKALRYRENREVVLLTGETGVGKEPIARILHSGEKHTFIPVNCARYRNNPQMLESELFGHEKGAFTGAITRKVGIFEAAKGGTVFLDEIAHLSIGAQAQLLRAIQEKKIHRLGGTHEYAIDVRIVAATNADLAQLVKTKEFLPDLYYRLKVLCIDIPPLRKRVMDIEPLVVHFCKQYLERNGYTKVFQPDVIRSFENFSWPGNVRELENTIIGLITDCPGDVVTIEQLDSRFDVSSTADMVRPSTLSEIDERAANEKRSLISRTLKASSTAAHAAKTLGVPATTLYSMLLRLGISMNLIAADLVPAT